MSGASTSEDYKIICFNCTLQIQLTLHVKCAECPATVCLPCFQFGAESGKHKRGHNYEIVDPVGASISGGEWGCGEESRLLRAAHQFKMGNWGEIVEIMGGSRRKSDDVKDYFDRVFIRGWMGQFAIKNSDWPRLKFEMFENGNLDKVLTANSTFTVEKLLLIRDALIDCCEDQIDENDPKLISKIEALLESYINKCQDGRINIEYERSKIGPTLLETEISFDECDPASDEETKKIPKKIKKENPDDYFDGLDQEAESDMDCTPMVSIPKVKKRKNARNGRETSSDTDEEEQKCDRDSEHLFNGLEKEEEEEDDGVYDSACEDIDDGFGYDTEDETTDKKSKKNATTPGTVRRKKRKRFWQSKKERRLTAYRGKMNRDSKKKERELEKLSDICPLEEMKELRNALPKLALETRTSGIERNKMRQDDLMLVGYNADREEFENEWFNEAEQLISRLILAPASDEKDPFLDIENDIKFARVQNYIRILGIRKAKRHAILEHEKITEFFNFLMSMTVEKRSASDVINDRNETEAVLARTQQFLTRDEYKSLAECVEKVESLTERISKLQELQRKGETSLKQVNNISTWGKKTQRKKLRKIDVDMKRKAGLEWKKYIRWHNSAVQEK